MGAGEYGGNGSVHWKVTNKKDRNHGSSSTPHTFMEVDEQPSAAQGGFFVVQVLDVSVADIRFKQTGVDASGPRGTLTLRVLIKHGDDYTRQVRITWPPDEIAFPPQDSQELEPVVQGAV